MNTLEVFMEVQEDENIKMELADVIKGEGTDDYTHLSNLPMVNSNTLIGDKNGNELGLINSEDSIGIQEIDRMFAAVFGN